METNKQTNNNQPDVTWQCLVTEPVESESTTALPVTREIVELLPAHFPKMSGC